MFVRERQEGRERGEGDIKKKQKQKNLFAINLAVADAVYTQHREVRREASAVKAKIQHGCVFFSLAFISRIRRSRFAATARIMRVYAFSLHVRQAGRCRAYHVHRRPLEQSD